MINTGKLSFKFLGGALFQVLRKQSLVRFCVVVWVYLNDSLIFCFTLHGDCTKQQLYISSFCLSFFFFLFFFFLHPWITALVALCLYKILTPIFVQNTLSNIRMVIFKSVLNAYTPKPDDEHPNWLLSWYFLRLSSNAGICLSVSLRLLFIIKRFYSFSL